MISNTKITYDGGILIPAKLEVYQISKKEIEERGLLATAYSQTRWIQINPTKIAQYIQNFSMEHIIEKFGIDYGTAIYDELVDGESLFEHKIWMTVTNEVIYSDWASDNFDFSFYLQSETPVANFWNPHIYLRYYNRTSVTEARLLINSKHLLESYRVLMQVIEKDE
jgi:hypothetical protein